MSERPFMQLQWFRLYHRIVDDEKVRLLAFEDRWHFISICCLKCSGLLDEPESDVKWRKVALKGDYPGLDRHSKPSSRWRRQAGALILCVTCIGFWGVSRGSEIVVPDPIGTVPSPAETSSVGFTQEIAVSIFDKEPQERLAPIDSINLFPRQGDRVTRNQRPVGVERHEYREPDLLFGVSILRDNREFGANVPANPDCFNKSIGSAEILENDARNKAKFGGRHGQGPRPESADGSFRLMQFRGLSAQDGQFNTDGCFGAQFGSPREPIGGLAATSGFPPEQQGRPAKDQRETSNPSGEESYWVGRQPYPKGFAAWLTRWVGFIGLVLGGVLLTPVLRDWMK